MSRPGQGRIRFPATGEEQPFTSLLELLMLIERHLPAGPDGSRFS